MPKPKTAKSGEVAPPPPVIKASAGSASAQASTGTGRGSQGISGKGAAGQTSAAKGDVSLGMMIEAAMAQAVKDTQKDSEAIWADAGMSDEEKKTSIAVLNDPAALRARMMQYRDKLRADWYAAAAVEGGPPEWITPTSSEGA